jgi:hypothetical protein
MDGLAVDPKQWIRKNPPSLIHFTDTAEAITTAGLFLEFERSEKGNGTSTTEPTEGVPMLHPPLCDSSPQQVKPRSTMQFHCFHWNATEE